MIRQSMSDLDAYTRDFGLFIEEDARMFALARFDPMFFSQMQLQSCLELTYIIAYSEHRRSSCEIEEAVADELTRTVERQLSAPLGPLKVRSNPSQPQALIGRLILRLSSSSCIHRSVFE